VPIAVLARLDGQRPSSALRAGALIGQSGEFSFVLASAGLALAAVPAEAAAAHDVERPPAHRKRTEASDP
jgi:Kef-type K+ transport system membrane component KefB